MSDTEAEIEYHSGVLREITAVEEAGLGDGEMVGWVDILPESGPPAIPVKLRRGEKMTIKIERKKG